MQEEEYKHFFQNGTAFLIASHFLQLYNGKKNISDFSHIILTHTGILMMPVIEGECSFGLTIQLLGT
jgi:hypothetical protein